MSAPIIALLAAWVLDEEHKRHLEDPDYEPMEPERINDALSFGLKLFLVMSIGIVISLVIVLNFGFWWGMLAAAITGLLSVTCMLIC